MTMVDRPKYQPGGQTSPGRPAVPVVKPAPVLDHVVRDVLREAMTSQSQREQQIQRRFASAIVMTLAGFTVLTGFLLGAGGPERLTSPFFTGPARVIPGWPWSWAIAISASGACLGIGWALQRWIPGVVGAAGIAGWSYSFACLSWLSMADETVGREVAWYPTAVYMLIGTAGLSVAVLLFALRRVAHGRVR